MLLAMFMQRIAVAEWDVVDPILEKDNNAAAEEPESLCEEVECIPCSPRKLRDPRDVVVYKKPNAQKWAPPAYNSKNAFR